MVRAQAPTGEGLGGPCRRRRHRTVTGWILDGHEALAVQALEDRERRRQWFTRFRCNAGARARSLPRRGRPGARPSPVCRSTSLPCPQPMPQATRHRAFQACHRWYALEPERPGGDQRERRAVDADRDLKILIVIARFVERRSAAVMMYLSIRVLPSRFSLRMVRRPRPV